MTDELRSQPQNDSSEDIDVEIAPLQVLPPVAPVVAVVSLPSAPMSPDKAPESVDADRAERTASRRAPLRVPDDEVKRSVPPVQENPFTFKSGASGGAMTPMRIIPVGQAPSLSVGISPSAVLPSIPDPSGAPTHAPTLLRRSSPSYPEGRLESARSPAKDSETPSVRRPVRTLIEPPVEDSWTPYQPTAIERPFTSALTAAISPSSPPFAAIPSGAPPASVPPPATPSDDLIRVDTDFDSSPPSSREHDRKSDPGEAPEITPEDLVSVENVAAATLAANDALSGRAKAVSVPPPPPPVATGTSPASMSGVPSVRPRQNSSPSHLPLPQTPHPATATASPKPPLVIVPPHVGMSPPVVDRKKPRLWWDEMFGDDLLRTMVDISDADILKEVEFIEDSLGIAKGGALLDLGCGTGRHAIELSRRGYEVVGLDLSLGMLAQAADLAQEKGEKLNFVQGDMREMTFDAMFDGVYCWNTTFGYFEEEKNALAVNRVHKALKKGGQFLLDVINRDYVVRQAPSLAWFEGDGCVCMDEMQIDWITSRMRVKRTMMLDDGRTKEVEYSIRVYSLHELGRILHEQGFRVCEVSGRITTPGVFFGNESPRTLILAEKR